MHFRSNTMFKLGYQAFIMYSVISAYVILDTLQWIKTRVSSRIFLMLIIPQLFLVSIYPLFSVRSYFGELKTYQGIWGLQWLQNEYPDNYAAMDYLNHVGNDNVIVEADGDSYTDYNQFSVFTGHPTVIGWAVHEWLWRGTYDVVAPRREDVRSIYESEDIRETKSILYRYNVRYVVIGRLERQKFTKLAEQKFAILGRVVFRNGETVIYELGGN